MLSTTSVVRGRFTYCGLIVRERWRNEYGIIGPVPYMAVLQVWKWYWRGFCLWTCYDEVGEMPIWLYCSRTCMGDPVLQAEEFAAFSPIETTHQEVKNA